jgi:maleylpyruvate isomerase
VPSGDIDGCRRAHARLLVTLDGLREDEARRASRLPGWTVGHLLSHLARNADSQVRLLLAGRAGDVGEQYPGGAAGREAEIVAGAGRGVGELVADVAESARRLEEAWRDTPAGLWAEGRGRVLSGVIPLGELPARRWREVEVHHVDLGLGNGVADWPDDYVEAELGRLVPAVPGRLPARSAVRLEATDSGATWTFPGAGAPIVVAAGRRQLVAWLLGRPERADLPALRRWDGGPPPP